MWEAIVVIGLLILTAIIFVVWLCVHVAVLIGRALFGLGRRKPAPHATLPQGWSACGHVGCRALNPQHARFCRRCGNATGATRTPVPMRYVA